MSWKRLRARVTRILFWRVRRARELDDEFQFHLNEETRLRAERGDDDEAARRAALKAFGNVRRAAEDTRSVWIPPIVDQLRQDLRYAARMYRMHPVFTAVAVLTLALGIGATSAVFGVVHSVLVRPLPVDDPGSLVGINWHSPGIPRAEALTGVAFYPDREGFTGPFLPFGIYELLKQETSVFSSVFAFSALGAGELNLTIDGSGGLALGELVSGEFFSGLGVGAAAGRLIGESDDRLDAAPVAVLSFEYWQRRFGQDPGALGQRILIERVPFTIVGVTPEGFYGPDFSYGGRDPEVFLPIRSQALSENPSAFGGTQRLSDPRNYWAYVMGRLTRGATIEQAQAALAPRFEAFLADGWEDEIRNSNGPSLLVQDGSRGAVVLRLLYRDRLTILMALMGLILIIACANVSSLLLSRASARRREMGVRLGLGASFGRVLRQLLTESVLLSVLAGGVGLVLAYWGIRLLTFLIANGAANFTLHAQLDLSVVLATVTASVVTGVVTGVAPIAHARRIDIVSVLRGVAASGVGHWFRWRRLRAGVAELPLIVQIAISIVLLVGAGLFTRSLTSLAAVDVGFNPENVVLFTVHANGAVNDEGLPEFYLDVHERIRALPGVDRTSFSAIGLLNGAYLPARFGTPGVGESDPTFAAVIPAGPSLLSTLEMPLLRGRPIEERDILEARPVAVVNEAFARAYFDGDEPIGRTVRRQVSGSLEDVEIVGLVRDSSNLGLRRDVEPMAFLPFTLESLPRGSMEFSVRTVLAASIMPAIREAVASVSPEVPVSDVRSQETQIQRLLGEERLFAAISLACAALVLIIAAVGIYAVTASSVVLRRRELAIRVAVGAERLDVFSMVLRDVALLFLAGFSVGVPLAYLTARSLDSMLFGVGPGDPAAIGVGAGLLLSAMLLAASIPASRAARASAIQTLRHD